MSLFTVHVNHNNDSLAQVFIQNTNIKNKTTLSDTQNPFSAMA